MNGVEEEATERHAHVHTLMHTRTTLDLRDTIPGLFTTEIASTLVVHSEEIGYACE